MFSRRLLLVIAATGILGVACAGWFAPVETFVEKPAPYIVVTTETIVVVLLCLFLALICFEGYKRRQRQEAFEKWQEAAVQRIGVRYQEHLRKNPLRVPEHRSVPWHVPQ